MRRIYVLGLLIVSFLACKNTPELVTKSPTYGTMSKNAMVVSAREEASRIGVEILKNGGNAFDAMVATEMALGVVYPYAGNLGGGGFMVYRTQEGDIGSIDFREKAPLNAHRDMYLDEKGNYLRDKSKIGALAVGVPGNIAGIFAVHEKMGSLPIEELLEPVIELAQHGYPITEKQLARFAKYRDTFLSINQENSIFTKTYKLGDTFKNEALAKTLQRIVLKGRSEFYEGETGEYLVEYIQNNGGIVELEDLKAYEVKWREPITFNYKDLRIISMAPPSSGGICLAQILKMIAPYRIEQYESLAIKKFQLLIEAERRAYADRSFYLGDPDFVTIPMDSLLDDTYLQHRMESFSFDGPTPSKSISYGHFEFIESTETTHYSIVDAFGNAVSSTSTLNGAYGSKLYVKELGFFLNNEMDDFSSKPGEPNMFGLVGGVANKIAPQKRMLSSMTPTIIEKNGKLWMIVGTPGGSSIITSVLQTILNVEAHGMTMQEAVNAPRFHHQWTPDKVFFEPNKFDPKIREQLEALGYVIDEKNTPITSKVAALLIHPDGRIEAGADPRGDDTAVGY